MLISKGKTGGMIARLTIVLVIAVVSLREAHAQGPLSSLVASISKLLGEPQQTSAASGTVPTTTVSSTEGSQASNVGSANFSNWYDAYDSLDNSSDWYSDLNSSWSETDAATSEATTMPQKITTKGVAVATNNYSSLLTKLLQGLTGTNSTVLSTASTRSHTSAGTYNPFPDDITKSALTTKNAISSVEVFKTDQVTTARNLRNESVESPEVTSGKVTSVSGYTTDDLLSRGAAVSFEVLKTTPAPLTTPLIATTAAEQALVAGSVSTVLTTATSNGSLEGRFQISQNFSDSAAVTDPPTVGQTLPLLPGNKNVSNWYDAYDYPDNDTDWYNGLSPVDSGTYAAVSLTGTEKATTTQTSAPRETADSTNAWLSRLSQLLQGLSATTWVYQPTAGVTTARSSEAVTLTEDASTTAASSRPRIKPNSTLLQLENATIYLPNNDRNTSFYEMISTTTSSLPSVTPSFYEMNSTTSASLPSVTTVYQDRPATETPSAESHASLSSTAHYIPEHNSATITNKNTSVTTSKSALKDLQPVELAPSLHATLPAHVYASGTESDQGVGTRSKNQSYQYRSPTTATSNIDVRPSNAPEQLSTKRYLSISEETTEPGNFVASKTSSRNRTSAMTTLGGTSSFSLDVSNLGKTLLSTAGTSTAAPTTVGSRSDVGEIVGASSDALSVSPSRSDSTTTTPTSQQRPSTGENRRNAVVRMTTAPLTDSNGAVVPHSTAGTQFTTEQMKTANISVTHDRESNATTANEVRYQSTSLPTQSLSSAVAHSFIHEKTPSTPETAAAQLQTTKAVAGSRTTLHVEDGFGDFSWVDDSADEPGKTIFYGVMLSVRCITVSSHG